MREDLEFRPATSLPTDAADEPVGAACEPELTLVRHVIASHVGSPVTAIGPGLDLSTDLGLSVVGRVLVALDLQDLSPVRWTFDDVRHARTVGELAALVRARRSRAH